MNYTGERAVENFPIKDIHVWNTQNGKMPYSKAHILDQYTQYLLAKDYTVDSFDKRHQADMEQDEVFQSCLQEAKGFILDELGYSSTSPVYFRPKNSNNMAEYCVDEDSIYATPPQDANDFLYRTVLTSILVHEMAHESSDVRRMFIFTDTEPCGTRNINIRWTVGMIAMKLSRESQRQTGDFFEEAFAETVASKWREATIPGYRERQATSFMTSYGVKLPVKYHSPNREFIDSGPITTNSGYPAIAAYGIELIGQHTGVDIYELMKEARQHTTEAAAKREIIRTINSVQPGLYSMLRDLKYDSELGEFEQGLKLIESAISADSSQKFASAESST